MTLFIAIAILIILLFIGVSVSVSLCTASFVHFILLFNTDAGVAIISNSIIELLNNYEFAAIAIFVCYGKLSEALDARAKIALGISGMFPSSRFVQSFSELLSGLIHPDTSADALVQRNEDPAAMVNRLRWAGVSAWNAIGQSASLSVIRNIAPPNILLIIVGTVFNISVGKLFFAALLPVFISSIVYLALSAKAAKKSTVTEKPFDWAVGIGASLIWLPAPLMILGGIFLGYLTPTQSGAFAIAFALLVGFFQRSISYRRILRAGVDALRDMGVLFLIAIFAFSFIRGVATSGYLIPTVKWIAGGGLPGTIAMLLGSLVLMLGSSIIGSVAMFFIASPFVFPYLVYFGFSPESVGLMVAVSLAFGPIIPPTGPVFVSLAAGTTAGTKEVLKGVAVYMLSGIAMVAPIILFPNLIDRMSNWLF